MKGIYGYYDKKRDMFVYIGKDSKIDKNKRYNAHLTPSLYDAQPFNRILQNNPDRYIYQVLVWDVKDEDTLNALEVQYIHQFNTFHGDNPFGWNFTRGGDGSIGRVLSYETRRKMSENHADFSGEKHPMYGRRGENNPNYGRKHREESKRKMSENNARYWQGKTRSEETKRKQSEKMKGDNNPMYGLTGEQHPAYGRKHTEEERQKISKNHYDCSGQNNPMAKYTLWDVSCAKYDKGAMFNGGREPNPCKCFQYTYKGKMLPIGYFHDFVSVEIINDLVEEFIGGNSNGKR